MPYLVVPNHVPAEITYVRIVPEEEGPVSVGGLLPVGDHARPALVRLKVQRLVPDDCASGWVDAVHHDASRSVVTDEYDIVLGVEGHVGSTCAFHSCNLLQNRQKVTLQSITVLLGY